MSLRLNYTMMNLNNLARGRFNIKHNVTIGVFDRNGKSKPIFQPNDFAISLLKRGLISPFIEKSPLFGHWAQEMTISNLVTSAGLAGVASRVNGSGAEAAFTYIAVGTGTNAANASDTTLQTEKTTDGLGRAAATVSRTTVDVTNDNARLTYTFSVTGTVAVTESGVLNASSNGVLLARQVFTAVNVVNTDSLAVTWDFDIDTA